MERPVLTELILDPPPPAYSDLKSLWAFEDNATDGGENMLTPITKNISYVAGVTGKAVKIGTDGYILLKGAGDTMVYPNGFKGVPADTLANLGSFTVAFWMNGVGPFTDGAQGVFSFSNKNEFWGSLDMFLENYKNDADPSEAFIKFHMFNAGVASGNGEEWSEVKVSKVFNKWTHIALTYDAASSKLTLFVDGLPITGINNKVLGGGSYGKVKFKDFNGLVLGTYQFQTAPSLTNHGPEGWARSFNGLLDQFRLYNRSLSPAEVTDLFTTKK
ncbi:MAG: LamG domain-containing protein [Ferruginibacter sp.]